MAGFVTANRWATGIETHKTKEGRILCTGVGCVGCFPDVYTVEANELGICDIDYRARYPIPLRPYLDEDCCYTREGKRNSRGKKICVKTLKRRKIKIGCKEGQLCESSVREKGDSKEGENSDRNPALSVSPCKSTIGTQTASLQSSDLETASETAFFVSGSKETSSDLDDPERKDDTSENIIGANLNLFDFGLDVKNNENIAQRNPQLIARTLYDKMCIANDASEKDIAMSSCERHVNEGNRISWQDQGAVCFFFALEFYGSQRILPLFRVMEIIEALAETVDLLDVKCVQRIYHRWHIVLKSRKYTAMLRETGLKLRGRVYHLVDYVDRYFDVVQ